DGIPIGSVPFPNCCGTASKPAIQNRYTANGIVGHVVIERRRWPVRCSEIPPAAIPLPGVVKFIIAKDAIGSATTTKHHHSPTSAIEGDYEFHDTWEWDGSRWY